MSGARPFLHSMHHTERTLPPSTDAEPPLEPVDPRPDEDYLPPWLWLTLCIICLICLLFISFRRAQSLELYQRARDHLLSKLPSSLHRGIRLSDSDLPSSDPYSYSYSSLPSHPRRRPVEGDLDDDDDDASDTSSLHSSPDRQQRDSYPSTAPLRSYSLSTNGTTRRLANEAKEQVQRGVGSVLDMLGWGKESPTPAGRPAGIAQAFWGLRKQDRTGGIRLGGGGRDEEEAVGGPSTRRSELSGIGGAISRIFDVAGGQRTSTTRGSSVARSGGAGSGHHRASSASSVSSGGALFEVGDDTDAGDAVELPAHFSLAAPSSGAASGTNSSSGSSARGVER